MTGPMLGELREYVDALASDDGRYRLVCARRGCRPVPAEHLTFESRPLARAAARATEAYHARLRRYDPRAPVYDVIVCEGSPELRRGESVDGVSTVEVVEDS